jgi:hypothetical protein
MLGEESLTLITDILTEVLQEIFNPDIPFVASDNPEARIFGDFELLY